MADTVPTGRTAPTIKPFTGILPADPIALHGEAINACALASYYARKGNYAGAARKTVQALAALRQLAALVQGGAQ